MLRSSSLALRLWFFIALLLAAQRAIAQTPAPLSAIIGRESTSDPYVMTENRTFKDSISGDGRFVVFTESFAGNFWGNVYLRDRYTRALRRINVKADGSDVVAPSSSASISANGRHVVFVACGQLTADDTNSVCDLYVRDLELNTLSRLSVGPSGESPTADAGFGSISNDGRFVAFTAVFTGQYGYPRLTWLRDRDPDQNGIFDEPGTSTTTLVSLKTDGTPAVSDYSVAVNGDDARYIAFTSWDTDVVPGYTPNGSRLYIRDRVTNTTFRVDVPAPDMPDEGSSMWADFSDDGSVIAYETTVRAAAGDEDNEFDVYLFNVSTGGNVLITPDDGSAPSFERVMLPSVSGDGRMVAVVAEMLGRSSWEMDAWTYDRETGQGRRVTKPLEWWDPTYNILEVALNHDGSDLLFSAYPNGLVYDTYPFNRAVFVITSAALTPEDEAVSADGGVHEATVSVKDQIAWSVRSPYDWITIDAPGGSGPGTFSYTVTRNTTEESRTGYIWLGNLRIAVNQPAAPALDWVTPTVGPLAGGTLTRLYGHGFLPDSRVLFGDVEAASVTFIDSRTLEAMTPAQTRAGSVPVKVLNPDGLIGSQTYGFWYIDETPPVLSYAVIGPQGLNGFYVGDVAIAWNVSDPESDLRLSGCDSRTFNEDGYFYAYCQAESEGGERHEWVYISRDATPPTIDIWWPSSPDPESPLRLARGADAWASYYCEDVTSGLASCEGDVPSGERFDTSTVGTFAFKVRATDIAGNQSSKQRSYVVLPPTNVALATASGVYGGTVALSATLTSDGAPVAGRTVRFTVSNFSSSIAVTGPDGVASVSIPLGTRTVGTYPLQVVFDGDDGYFESYAEGQLAITRATPQLTWATPAPIVYPTLLSTTQFNAVASVDGMFNYSPAANVPLSAGVHTLSVTFTPEDSINYTQATASVMLTVLKPASTITWSAPASIVFGTALSGTQLNATANYPGTFTYAPAAGTVLGAGTHALTVTFTPTDPNVNGATANVALTVLKATPQLTWNPPAPIVYGTALGASQLNASASVAGTFSYSPAPGAVLTAGVQLLAVTFTPSDGSNYQSVSGSVSISVAPAALTIRTNDATKVYGETVPAFTAGGIGLVNGDSMGSLAGTLTFSTAASQTSSPGTYAVTPGGVSSPNYAIAFQNGTLTVTKAATTMALIASPSPSFNNKPVKLTATIGATAPGSGVPTGSVEFRDKGTLLGTAPIVNGSASLTVSLRKGSHPLTASWAGDANFTGSNSAMTHQVN